MEKNILNLKEQWLKLYVEHVTKEQLKVINDLLEQNKYEEVDKIIEEYAYNIINNKDYKSSFGGNDGTGNTKSIGSSSSIASEQDEEKMESQSFELYCILKLIDQYINELDNEKKQLIHIQIQNALEHYRKPQEEKTHKTL